MATKAKQVYASSEVSASKEEVPDTRIVGKILQEAREKAGLSQTQVANEFGWPTGQFISSWELEKARMPLKYVKRIAKLYGIENSVIRKAMARMEIRDVKKKYGVVDLLPEKKYGVVDLLPEKK